MQRVGVYIGIGIFAGCGIGILIGLGLSKPNQPERFVSEIVSEYTDSTASAGYALSVDDVYVVVRVIDGDTIQIQRATTTETVRLIGVDTPEAVDPRKPIQCFGKEASAFTKHILEGKQVTIETDPSQGMRDKYNRLLAYIFYNGENFNEQIIREGYGYEYTYKLPYRYQVEFEVAEDAARTNKRGLWADGACDPMLIEEKAGNPPQPRARTGSSSGNYICTENTYNCSDFTTRAAATEVLLMCDGENDVHRLDQDGDGIPCESLP